jgi:uncharacterized protein (TIGR02266 family)
VRKRTCQRFTKRLEVTFSSEGSKFRGISSDLSAGGLFIRTQHGMTPGRMVDIEVYLPDDKVGRLRGVVRRTIKTALSVVKNGMGVELIETDQNYLDFLRKFEMIECNGEGAEGGEEKKDKPPESIITACPKCNVKNRVSVLRLSHGAKCGKCGALLELPDIS